MINEYKIPVSVIIPVYNGEEYLPTCFNCLNNQTLKDFEVIFINDGSTDNSLLLLKEYKIENNNNTTIINNEQNLKSDLNKSNALKQARGEFVVFIDCDDKISANYLEILHKTCIQNNSDVCICDSYIEFDAKTGKEIIINSLQISLNGLNCVQSYRELHGIIGKIHRAAWGKIYRNSFLKSKNVSFNEQDKCFGDVLFNFKVLLSANGISFCKNAYYFYRINNNNSLVGSQKRKELYNRKYYIWCSVFELFKNAGAYQDFELELCQFVYNDLFWLSRNLYFYNIVRKTIIDNTNRENLTFLFNCDSVLKKIYYTPGYNYIVKSTYNIYIYMIKIKLYSWLAEITKKKSYLKKVEKYRQKRSGLCI